LKALHHFSSTSLAFLLSEGRRGFLNNLLEVGESSDRTELVEEELILPMVLVKFKSEKNPLRLLKKKIVIIFKNEIEAKK
jgi:hypothetical protein